jgi:ribose/xylose/arabinose/galactoside ABC-type transport system permease subunit
MVAPLRIAHSGRANSSVLPLLARNWSAVFLLGMVLVFSFTGDNFFALNNFQNIIHLSTSILLLASAETFVIITGGIDLSVGFIMGFSSVLCARITQLLFVAGLPAGVCILIGITSAVLGSLLAGLASGLLVARYRVPPFIATLGVLGVFTGITLHISGGFPVGNLPPVITEIGNGYLLYFHPPSRALSFFSRPAGVAETQIRELVRIIPNSVLFILLFVTVLWHLLKNTRFGLHTYAIGGSRDAALRSGIDVQRHLTVIYLLSAFLSSLAGIFFVFQTGIGNHTPWGANYELFAIAAVIIGGASLMGGKGRIMASAIGVIVLKVLENGLTLSGIEPFYRYIAVGLILIVAVVIDQLFPDLF